MELRRREFAALMLGGAAALSLAGRADAETDPLPSWNAGPAKDAIVKFVNATTDAASPSFVPLAERIATFDQDGTLWVEHPIYTQLVYCFDRVPGLVKAKPELAKVEPFRTVLTGDREAIAGLGLEQFLKVVAPTLTGTDVDTFRDEVAKWIAEARDPRWKRPYTDLVYAPQIELLKYLRTVGYRTSIVTGGGQDFVRVYSEQVYGVVPEQVIGSAVATKYTYDNAGAGILMRPPELLLNNNFSGKPEDIYLFTGSHPQAAFGNSTGDQQMLEYTQAGPDAHLMMIVLHDDAQREYAYGPADGLPPSDVGTFTQALYDEAKSKGWIVISMKHDWKQIFAWEK